MMPLYCYVYVSEDGIEESALKSLECDAEQHTTTVIEEAPRFHDFMRSIIDNQNVESILREIMEQSGA